MNASSTTCCSTQNPYCAFRESAGNSCISRPLLVPQKLRIVLVMCPDTFRLSLTLSLSFVFFVLRTLCRWFVAVGPTHSFVQGEIHGLRVRTQHVPSAAASARASAVQ